MNFSVPMTSGSKSPEDEENSNFKGRNPLYDAVQNRRLSVRSQPTNTILYKVEKSDTLTSIAARFNTTPAELAILNKLGCRVIFPNQIIYVPDMTLISLLSKPNTSKQPDENQNGQPSPKPGRVQRISSSDSEEQNAEDGLESPSHVAEDLNKESLSKFLKINAKHITDGEGVVNGVLLVTPNHLMFDPNVSDPLVMEHGVEKYGVVAPIHMVVRTALFTDIVRMRTKECTEDLKSEDSSLKIYHSKPLSIKKSFSDDDSLCMKLSSSKVEDTKDSLTVTVDSKEDNSLNKLKQKLSLISENSLELPEDRDEGGEEDEEADFPPTKSSPELVNVDLTDEDSTATSNANQPLSGEDEADQSPEEKVLPTTKVKKTAFERTRHKLQKGLLKLPRRESLFPSAISHRRMSLPTSASFQELKSKVFPSAGSATKKPKPEKPVPEVSTTYMNMVDEKPDLFTSIEKLIPRPAKSFGDNPLYLCLRLGQPMDPSAKVKVTPVMTFGRKLKSEYWFSIPRTRVDNLYYFLLRWVPERYGEVYNINFEELGFFPINEDAVEEEDEQPSVPPPVSRNRSASWAFPWRRKKSTDSMDKSIDPHTLSWEFVTNEESETEESIPASEASLPELLTPSDILTEEHIKTLSECLPPRAIGYSWKLIYSTTLHGFSLKTMYREMLKLDCPILIVITNTTGTLFGCVLSNPLKMSDHFYGTGETFLYTFTPEFKCYNWTGENTYFIKGNTGSFAVGASDGKFGLWLDDDLFHGCSKECQTFGNDPLCEQEDFIVKSLEAWGFV